MIYQSSINLIINLLKFFTQYCTYKIIMNSKLFRLHQGFDQTIDQIVNFSMTCKSKRQILNVMTHSFSYSNAKKHYLKCQQDPQLQKVCENLFQRLLNLGSLWPCQGIGNMFTEWKRYLNAIFLSKKLIYDMVCRDNRSQYSQNNNLAMQSQQGKPIQSQHQKMNSMRNMSKRTPSNSINRIRLHNEQQVPTNIVKAKNQKLLIHNQSSQKMDTKVRPSTAKRPISSNRKLGQTKVTSKKNDSNTAYTVNGYNQNDVIQLISTNLCHNPIIKEFLREKNISESHARDILVNNGIYILTLLGILSKTSQQKVNKVVQKSIISKINKILIFEGQIEHCQQIQSKIQQLIQKRIRVLSSYEKS